MKENKYFKSCSSSKTLTNVYNPRMVVEGSKIGPEARELLLNVLLNTCI